MSDNTNIKAGDKVMFIGATEDQVNWGGNDDPNKYLKQGDVAEIGIPGKFNSVSFKPAPTKQQDRIRISWISRLTKNHER